MFGASPFGSTPFGSGPTQTTAPISTVTSVTVTPSTVTVAGGGTVDFDWVINGTNSPSQSATITTNLGMINSAGVLSAPAAISTEQTGTVTVTSNQDPIKSGTATFTIAAAQAGDTNAPTLTDSSATATGQTTAAGTVTTNEASGTLFWRAATAAPTVAAIKAGSAQAITSAGVKNLFANGLAPNTTYRFYSLHRDVAGNDSAVVISPTFHTYSIDIPGGMVDASTVAAARRVVFGGSTRVIVFGGGTRVVVFDIPNIEKASTMANADKPYFKDEKWLIDKDPNEKSYYVADVTKEILDRATSIASVEVIVGGVTLVEGPDIQGNLIVVQLEGMDETEGADNFWTARVTCANTERFDRTTWLNRVDN